MGIIRKVTSISTFGLVRFRTPSERTARFTRQTRNAVQLNTLMNTLQNQQIIQAERDQVAVQRAALTMDAQRHAKAMEHERQQIALQRQAVALQGGVSADWYPDPTDNRALCWWDGGRWHSESKHFPQATPALPPAMNPRAQ
jgi:Protein of unknown function (DUF2510)